MFQSPSLRGSGRFDHHGNEKGDGVSSVSIPFIAGQWSLRRLRFQHFHYHYCVSIPFIAGQWSLHKYLLPKLPKCTTSFNPLHCGAVVASEQEETVGVTVRVSIPFIAGQWSLLPGYHTLTATKVIVSIPFIAGQWSLPFLGLSVSW